MNLRNSNFIRIFNNPNTHSAIAVVILICSRLFLRSSSSQSRAESRLSGRIFDCFTRFAGVLLNPAKQFLRLTFDALEFVVRELGLFLFQLAFDDVKVTFDFEFCHKISGF